MKVLHVIPSVSELMGGPTSVIFDLVRESRQHGVQDEIVTTNDNGRRGVLDVQLNSRIEFKGVPVWFFKRSSVRMRDYLFSASLTKWLWQNIDNYDLIYCHYLFSYAPTIAALIARWRKVPYVMRTIGQLSPWAFSNSGLKKSFYMKIIERKSLNCASMILCSSDLEKKHVEKFNFKAPVEVVPLGVNDFSEYPNAKKVLREKYQISEQTPIVLILGRLHPVKSVELLLKAFDVLSKKGFDSHLLIAGSGNPDYERKLKDFSTELGLMSNITFTGLVSGEDKVLLIRGSDVFVSCSKMESFGMALVEAMSVGLPVVVTPGIQISSDIITAKAGLLAQENPEDLSGAIIRLLESPGLRAELGENGRSLVMDKYSWGKVVELLKRKYEEIIRSGRAVS